MKSDFALLLSSLILGGTLGIFYDVFRILRIAFRGKKKRPESYRIRLPATESEAEKAMNIPKTDFSFRDIPLFFSDVIFCLISGAAVTALLFSAGDGKLRFFAVFGVFAAFAAYHFTVGKIVIFFSEMIISAVKKTALFILKITVFPVFGVISSVFLKVRRKIIKRKIKAYSEKTEKKLLAEAGRAFGYADDKTKDSRK